MFKKRAKNILLIIIMIISLLPSNTFAATTVQARPTSSGVILDGAKTVFEAYNINSNNFFKLRDLAKSLNGGAKQFEVTWDASKNAVIILTNHAYTPVGGELAILKNTSIRNAILTTAKVYVNGIEKMMTAYNINGNNYFKLRDIGTTIDFGVAYDGVAKTIIINTESISFTNSQFGFKFTLPKTWENYSIVTDKWTGTAFTGIESGVVVETGPILNIRHPQWAAKTPRQDIPIMIFTLNQWIKLQNEEFAVGAAPILPSELGRNTAYVFALPARYNFAFPLGFEEVESILTDTPLQTF